MKKVIVLTVLFLSALYIPKTPQALAAEVTYIYDDLNRLTDIIYLASATISYGYDEVGNRELEMTDAEPRDVSIQYATCRGNGATVTIKSEGFSHYIDAPDSGLGISAATRQGPVDCQVNSWNDTLILATCSECPATVAVNSIWGTDAKSIRVLGRR